MNDKMFNKNMKQFTILTTIGLIVCFAGIILSKNLFNVGMLLVGIGLIISATFLVGMLINITIYLFSSPPATNNSS